MKISFEELKSRFMKAEEIISKAENKLTEIVQPEKHKEKKKNEEN